LKALRELGIEAYPAAEYKVTHSTAAALENFEQLAASKEKVRIAGRIRSRRACAESGPAPTPAEPWRREGGREHCCLWVAMR